MFRSLTSSILNWIEFRGKRFASFFIDASLKCVAKSEILNRILHFSLTFQLNLLLGYQRGERERDLLSWLRAEWFLIQLNKKALILYVEINKTQRREKNGSRPDDDDEEQKKNEMK